MEHHTHQEKRPMAEGYSQNFGLCSWTATADRDRTDDQIEITGRGAQEVDS